jgi:hypothetical protein
MKHTQHCDYFISAESHATGRKVMGSSPDEVIEFFSMYPILPGVLGPEVYSAPNRNEYQKQKNNVSGE